MIDISKYIKIDMIRFLEDWQYYQVALQAKRDILREMEETSGVGALGYGEKAGGVPARDGLENFAVTMSLLRSEIGKIEAYNERFITAYNSLGEEEKCVIDAYRALEPQPIKTICERLHVEKSQAYRIRTKTFSRFAMMML